MNKTIDCTIILPEPEPERGDDDLALPPPPRSCSTKAVPRRPRTLCRPSTPTPPATNPRATQPSLPPPLPLDHDPTMKILSIQILSVVPHNPGTPAVAVAAAMDLSSFSFYQRGRCVRLRWCWSGGRRMGGTGEGECVSSSVWGGSGEPRGAEASAYGEQRRTTRRGAPHSSDWGVKRRAFRASALVVRDVDPVKGSGRRSRGARRGPLPRVELLWVLGTGWSLLDL